MNKEFIPYEQALELKKLGFDDVCLGYYHTTLSSSGVDLIIGKTPNRFYHLIRIPEHFDTLAPLYQQAFRWFREKKISNSAIHRYQDRTDGSINFAYYIIHDYGIDEVKFMKEEYTSYEEAELACLKKLIEIAKNK
jgi:hypothetical protein